jgi:hypothetical protein
MTVSGDLEVTGDLNILGSTVVNTDTKLSLTNKNIFMNVPEEPLAPSGTTTIDVSGIVTAMTVTNVGVNFAANEVVNVVFVGGNPSQVAQATVTASASGVVDENSTVNIIDGGLGYLTEPTFDFGNPSEEPVGNKPQRAAVDANGSGTIVIRDWFDGTEPHAGIIWNEIEQAWDINSPIKQDVYEDSPAGATNTFPVNPRLINIGDPVDPKDAVNLSTITSLVLDDLSDVSAPHSNGFVLKSDGSEWIAGNISISDIDGISTPSTSSGYFFWDHTGDGGNGEFIFVENIAASDISGLAAVATDGSINSLTDVNVTPSDQQVLTWDEDALGVGQGAWVATDKISVGDLDTIQSPSVSPTASVSTVGDNVSISADNQFTVITGGLGSISTVGDFNIDTNATLNFSAENPIVVNTGSSTEGEIKAQGDLIFTSDAGNVILHNVAYPKADINTANESMLFYNSTSGEMEWGLLPSSSIQHRIENTLGTTFVDTEIENDTVVLQAPSVGDPSNGSGTVTNTVGVILDAGEGRDVLFPGSLVSHIYSDTGLLMSTTVGDIDIVPNGTLKLDGYIFPEDTATRNAGDVLLIDPADTAFKNNLIFSSLELNINSDVSITGGLLEQQVLIANSSGTMVNRKLTYNDIDQTTIPTPSLSFLSLTDTYDPTGLVPSVPDDLKDKFLRWDEQGTQVVYEDVINASDMNLVGVITDIVPSTTNVKDIGTSAFKFRDIYVSNVNANTLSGTYTNAAESITESMLTQSVQDKLNSSSASGDATLAGDQVFTGGNSFIPNDSSAEFVVATNDGNIELSTNTADINISSVDGSVNITGYSRAIIVDINYTLIPSGTGTLVINVGEPIQDNAIVTACRVNVSSAFNGVAPTIAVGSVADPDILMSNNENDMESISLNHSNTFYEVINVANKKQLTAQLVLDGATTGAAKLFIEYYVM